MTHRILANDGIHAIGKEKLEAAGIEVVDSKIDQSDLISELNNFDGIVVRSATTVRKDLIDACPRLQIIGRAGVGMDNIDVDYARSIGRTVVNTPAASSESVAELVFAHLFTGARFLHRANREMAVSGDTDFAKLKKSYSKGIELRGKNLGIIGFGRIGQAVARIGLGLGMNIVPHNHHYDSVEIDIDFFKIQDASVRITIKNDTLDDVLAHADFITMHVPYKAGNPPVIGKEHFAKMKDGVMLVNSSRGGAVCEDALLDALESGKVAFAGLDVFENEPMPRKELLNHPQISVTPHIGASTGEAQTRIWIEMADQIIEHLNK